MIVALLIKPALILGAAWLLTTLLRGRSAAARHAVWAGAIVATLVVPVLPASIPQISIPTSVVTASSRGVAPFAPAWIESEAVATGLPDILLIVWLAGIALLGTRRLVAQLRLHGIVRRARHIEEGILLTDEILSPAVAGVLRPVILLPESAVESDGLDAILVHERAHIARRDSLVNLLADAAKIVYWCNPVVHWAARRLRVESERACDDRVVLSGAEPGWYAQLLLTMASHGDMPRAATAMARARELESRILAVLDGRVRRAATSPISLGALGLMLALPISALTLQQGDSISSPLSERLPVATIPASARLALQGPDSALARLIPLLRHPVWRLRSMAASALRASLDPSAERAMDAALADPAWQVRLEAVQYFAVLDPAERALNPH